ncbi:MAG: hypothetical protein U0930_24615 [Pirellulales bacterium]
MTSEHRPKLVNRIFLFVFGLTVFCGGGGLVVLLLTKAANERKLSERLERLSEKGFPIDSDSLKKLHYQLSSDENANEWASIIDEFSSTIFKRNAIDVPIVGENVNLIPIIGNPWPDQILAERLLEEYRPSLRQLLRISQDNGPVLYPIAFAEGESKLPSRAGIIHAARVLLLEAMLAARAGDSQREFRAINSMLGCALSIRGEPWIGSQNVSLGTQGMALAALQSAVEAIDCLLLNWACSAIAWNCLPISSILLLRD